jgi:hypothetical protein
MPRTVKGEVVMKIKSSLTPFALPICFAAVPGGSKAVPGPGSSDRVNRSAMSPRELNGRGGGRGGEDVSGGKMCA